MRTWLVLTPQYRTRDDPPAYCTDAIEVEATSQHEALQAGVKMMLDNPRFHWCREQQDSGMSPLRGLKVESMTKADVPERIRGRRKP